MFTGVITIPLWLFFVLLLVVVWAVLERVLIPSTRWFLRRRINRMIDEVSKRLAIEIRPFQLTKRRVLIDRLAYDPQVIDAIQTEARQQGIPREVLQARVFTYAKEIVPSFNAYIYFRIGYWIAKKIAGLLYKVRVGVVDEAQLSTIDPKSTVVFAMNHRSNMDYIIVAFLVAERTTLSYAVGEWAKIWPLQTLIRAMGAFFVRRNSGDALYRKVLERYIHMATAEGVCQAVFLEGGLSRDGRLRTPKKGIIDYMLRDFNPHTDRDIVFVPVGINYDRTLEDRSLLRLLDPAAEKRSGWFVFRTTLRFVRRSLVLMISSRWQRYGFACVNFGPQVSMSDYCRRHGLEFHRMTRQHRFPEIDALCRRLMRSIARVVPVLPVSLLATVFLRNSDRSMTVTELQVEVDRLIEELKRRGAAIYASPRHRRHQIVNALAMLKMRHLVVEMDDAFKADSDMADVLTYYANSIGHWFDSAGMLDAPGDLEAGA